MSRTSPTSVSQSPPPAPKIPPSILAVAERDSATCLGCGYALRGLVEARNCPECGRAFVPNDPMSMRTPQRLERALRRALWWAPVSVWLLVVLAVAVASIIFRLFSPLAVVAAIMLAGYLRRLARRSLLAGGPEPSPVSEGVARVGTWVLCVLLLISGGQLHLRTCPHGTLVGVGPVGVAHSRIGGPCRN